MIEVERGALHARSVAVADGDESGEVRAAARSEQRRGDERDEQQRKASNPSHEWFLLLEAIADVEAHQVRVGLVRAVEIVLTLAPRAARLEMKRELGQIDDQRAVVISDSEAGAFAVTIREDRADIECRLRVLVVKHSEPDVVVAGDRMVRAEPVRKTILPIRHSVDALRRSGQQID